MRQFETLAKEYFCIILLKICKSVIVVYTVYCDNKRFSNVCSSKTYRIFEGSVIDYDYK